MQGFWDRWLGLLGWRGLRADRRPARAQPQPEVRQPRRAAQPPGATRPRESQEPEARRAKAAGGAARPSADASELIAKEIARARADAKSARAQLRESALEWAEARWDKLLRTLRFEPDRLEARWAREAREGLSEPERKLAPKNAKKFLDGLLIARRWTMLDALWGKLERSAFQAHLQSKTPTLANWAAGQIEEGDLLPTQNPDLIDWARQKGAFEPRALRHSHVADALSAGDAKRAQEAIDDSGRGRLEPPDATKVLEAMARKRELGNMEGLGQEQLAALWQALGGEGAGLESLAGLPPAELAWALAKLIDAMARTEEAERALIEQTAKINSKRARELVARVLAAQAASQERVGMLRATIERAPALMGVSQQQAANARSPAVVARVGEMRARAERAEGVSLREAAALSGSEQAARELDKMGAQKADPKAMRELADSAAKDVRRQMMRSQLAEEHAKAWRQTLTEWKSGVLGENATLQDLESRVREKADAARRERSRPGQSR
jgi:hypothetical protein